MSSDGGGKSKEELEGDASGSGDVGRSRDETEEDASVRGSIIRKLTEALKPERYFDSHATVLLVQKYCAKIVLDTVCCSLKPECT